MVPLVLKATPEILAHKVFRENLGLRETQEILVLLVLRAIKAIRVLERKSTPVLIHLPLPMTLSSMTLMRKRLLDHRDRQAQQESKGHKEFKAQ